MSPQFFWSVEQGSPEWYRLRSGVPTSSEFDKILTPKTMKISAARRPYQCRLIAERIMNWQADSLDKIQHVADGKAHEPFAVAKMEEIYQLETERVGFVLSGDGKVGTSPDRVANIGPDRASVGTVIECKSPTIPKMFEYLLLGDNDAYICQRQGQLLVAEADKAIFFADHPRMPCYRVETGRDEPFIRKLAGALEQFNDEFEALMEKAQSLGVYQAFTELRTPLDQEYRDNIRRAPMETEEQLAEILTGSLGARMDWGG